MKFSLFVHDYEQKEKIYIVPNPIGIFNRNTFSARSGDCWSANSIAAWIIVLLNCCKIENSSKSKISNIRGIIAKGMGIELQITQNKTMLYRSGGGGDRFSEQYWWVKYMAKTWQLPLSHARIVLLSPGNERNLKILTKPHRPPRRFSWEAPGGRWNLDSLGEGSGESEKRSREVTGVCVCVGM